MQYSETLLNIFHNIQHGGKLDASNNKVRVAQFGQVKQGDMIVLFIQTDKAIIETAKFQAYGSVTTIACAEVLCHWLEGKTLQQARQLNTQQLFQALSLPPTKIHIVRMLERVLGMILKE